MAKSIADKIFENKAFGKDAYFSGRAAIEEFFEDLPKELAGIWPMDFSEEGLETEYYSANITGKQAGFVRTLQIKGAVKGQDSEYVVAMDFDFDGETFDVELESMFKAKGKSNVPNKIIGKLKNFVSVHDQAMGNSGKNSSSIGVNAKSGFHHDSGQELFGGYVWANHGFSFGSKYGNGDLKRIQGQFKEFCSEQGVNISDKDLAKFTIPCHFAAFDCGVEVVNKLGKPVHIGNAFMSTQSWHGKWSGGDEDSAQEKYAKEYYNENTPKNLRRKNAVMALGSGYFKMLKKYAEQSKKKTDAKAKPSIKENIQLMRARLAKAISG
ncbi:MAG: hypothetical protein LBR70_05730 [Lactobacillaceae bacterium]|jgi:hypothetical protein|nr:hypothetical protein [Lactobacillaceae bacterium]